MKPKEAVMSRREVMRREVEPEGKLRLCALYLGDNGRCFCGQLKCAGMTAWSTGYTLSGQRVHRITNKDMAALAPAEFRCETCGYPFEVSPEAQARA